MTDQSNQDERDDFTQPTRELLAKRAGYICGYPNCRRMTVAGSEDRKSGVTLTGVAAHITAAAKGGPRYDHDMEPEERSGEENGFWACQIHGKFIDDNPSKCTVEELRRWKTQHEKWVFYRVESGKNLFNEGICQFSISNVGIFHGKHETSLGKHNVLVGFESAGVSTICQAIAAFGGEPHWESFNDRFKFAAGAGERTEMSITHRSEQKSTVVQLSPQYVTPARHNPNGLQRIHVESDGKVAVDWPKSLFRSIYLENQFRRQGPGHPGDLKSALRYLASLFCLPEDFVWDSLRDELFATSIFGTRFVRRARRKVDVLTPRNLHYLPHGNLSSAEIRIAYLDILLKLVLASGSENHWILLIDNPFFGLLDKANKSHVFSTLMNLQHPRLQTVFCLGFQEDAEMLKALQSDRWVGANKIGDVTIHSFL
jgi:hypothetical protein